MNKKYLFWVIITFGILLITFLTIKIFYEPQTTKEYTNFTGTVLGVLDENLIVSDEDNVIHSFNGCNTLETDDEVVIKYSGILDNQATIYECEFKSVNQSIDLPKEYEDDGLFSQYYKLAYEKLSSLSLDEKIGQLLLARYPDDALEVLNQYPLAGFVFYEKDFKDKNVDQVKEMLSSLQKKANIPLLLSTDEEGGKVIRVSSNPQLVANPFLSSSEIYQKGGLTAIKEDTQNKSKILNELGLNVNLAPVVDVSTDSSDYIYERSLKKDTDEVTSYAQAVIEASKNTGVSYVLKHFPGYGSAKDTHYSASVNDISSENLKKKYLPPFESGIKSDAEAILVSHIIVDSIDEDNPASLSINAHNLLRNDLNFTGVIISDDLAMGAVSSTPNVEIKALLAGNDLLITTDYEQSFKNIKEGLANNNISESLINKLAFKVLAWKYYKGLMFVEK